MTKQEFIRTVSAMLAAGGTTESIDAMAMAYSIAAHDIDLRDLAFVCDITVGFLTAPPRDNAVEVEMKNGKEMVYLFAINERALFRWVASPCGAFVVSRKKFKWTVNGTMKGVDARDISGIVRWMGDDMLWRNTPFSDFCLSVS